MDSAFFSDDIVSMLDTERIKFTISVPFERFSALKALIEKRKRWCWAGIYAGSHALPKEPLINWR